MQSIVSGKIARLILIQLQFVKKELLTGMRAVDDLFSANHVNLQLLAITPAVLAYIAGTLLVRSMWSMFSTTMAVTTASTSASASASSSACFDTNSGSDAQGGGTLGTSPHAALQMARGLVAAMEKDIYLSPAYAKRNYAPLLNHLRSRAQGSSKEDSVDFKENVAIIPSLDSFLEKQGQVMSSLHRIHCLVCDPTHSLDWYTRSTIQVSYRHAWYCCVYIYTTLQVLLSVWCAFFGCISCNCTYFDI
jgi:hypothetical protein